MKGWAGLSVREISRKLEFSGDLPKITPNQLGDSPKFSGTSTFGRLQQQGQHKTHPTVRQPSLHSAPHDREHTPHTPPSYNPTFCMYIYTELYQDKIYMHIHSCVAQIQHVCGCALVVIVGAGTGGGERGVGEIALSWARVVRPYYALPENTGQNKGPKFSGDLHENRPQAQKIFGGLGPLRPPEMTTLMGRKHIYRRLHVREKESVCTRNMVTQRGRRGGLAEEVDTNGATGFRPPSPSQEKLQRRADSSRSFVYLVLGLAVGIVVGYTVAVWLHAPARASHGDVAPVARGHAQQQQQHVSTDNDHPHVAKERILTEEQRKQWEFAKNHLDELPRTVEEAKHFKMEPKVRGHRLPSPAAAREGPPPKLELGKLEDLPDWARDIALSAGVHESVLTLVTGVSKENAAEVMCFLERANRGEMPRATGMIVWCGTLRRTAHVLVSSAPLPTP